MESLTTEPSPLAQSAQLPLGRRERKKLATRTAMHHLAMELFLRNGFRETRISEIAEAADVSESTFFRYFDSKEGVALEGLRQLAEAIVSAVGARPIYESPIDACLAVNRNDKTLRITEDDLPSLDLLRKTPELASKTHVILRQTVSALADEFARRLGRSPRNLEVRLQTHVVIAAAIAALEIWIEAPESSDPKQMSEQALLRLRDGFFSTADTSEVDGRQ